jgi:hypothetical protein
MTGLSKSMGAVGDGVCDHCMIFDSFQQCFARLFPTIAQFATGGFIVTVSFSLCS